jgi:hypothetical protein
MEPKTLSQLYAATAKERDQFKRELAYTKNLLQQARSERDIVTKRMIGLEQKLVEVIANENAG